MALPHREVAHPHITRAPGCCGGRPLRQGMTPGELVREFSHLTLAQVYDALSYYYDRKEDIDQEMHANTAPSAPHSWEGN